jgi:hypothetical protein
VILGFEVRVAQQGIFKNSELSMKLSSNEVYMHVRPVSMEVLCRILQH